MQIVPVTIDAGSYNADEPASVQFVGGVNRWAWELRQAGILIDAQTLAYGEITEQFAELAALWATYRLDSVEITYVPSQTGSGQQTATISAIDPAGDTNNLPIVDALTSLSRLRSVTLTDSRKQCRRKVDFRNWLIQCAPQPFLQTIDLSASPITGARETYPESLANTAPLIRMAFQTTPGVTVTGGLVLGFFRVNAKYTVRGRRGRVLDMNVRMALYTDREREEALKLLVKQFGKTRV